MVPYPLKIKYGVYMSGIDNQRIGALAELSAQMYYVREGYEVYTPMMPQSKCDFIVSKGSELIKVQVKKATENRTKYGTYLQVRLQGKPTTYGTRFYTEDDFDELLIIHDSGIWRIPAELVIDKKSFTFGKLLEDGSVVSGNKASLKTEDFKVH